MSLMSGPVTARWFNPVTGGYSQIGSALSNSGIRQFVTPGENGTYANDWVLVLDTAASH
jgi:hypothetical protein